jgi:hypothetical protein
MSTRSRTEYWREYKRTWTEQNREALAAQKRAYYEQNRDAFRERARSYYEQNRQRILARRREQRRAARAASAKLGARSFAP